MSISPPWAAQGNRPRLSGQWTKGATLLVVGYLLAACSPYGASPPTAADRPGAQEPPEGLEVGQRAPAFTVTTLDGKPLSSADLLSQGKPFILYFFATW